jgi:hypothetical protein
LNRLRLLGCCSLEDEKLNQSSEKALERLVDYRECADRLFAIANPRAIEDAARTLALYVGYYQRRHGPISIGALATLSSETASPEQVADLAEGMRCLAAALTLANTLRVE